MTSTLPPLPRHLDPAKSFDALVNWVHDEIIVKRGAPGLAVSVSGTDSVLAFLACAKAFEKAGKPNRVAAIHYDKKMPPEPELSAQLAENPHAFWFQRQVLPWLKTQAPEATFLVDDSIEYYRDGARWGALMDWSVVENMKTGQLRPREQSYWVVGTRNRTEETLMQYSNVSNAASMQPLIHLWKSEVLELCEHLGVPKIAMEKSCEADCVCGRQQLPALHIPEVDALLMEREGLLDPAYNRATIPAALRTQLAHYIDGQLTAAGFKKQIPYLPDAASIALGSAVPPDDLAAAKQVAAGIQPDTKPLTRLLPQLLEHGHTNAACDLLCTPSADRTPWLPEALMLFATPNLHRNQKHIMAQHFFGSDALSSPVATQLARCNARLGHYGFSFPKWRFTTQRTGDVPALVEQFGMHRLERATDLRDASLPPSNPDRDLYGTGFEWHNEDWYVEYRRGYLVCSKQNGDQPATLVIRNNSYFFGRDRLPSPVYVSFAPQTPESLKNISADQLEHSGEFTPWQKIAQTPNLPPLHDISRRMNGLLAYLDAFDQNLSQWLSTCGPVPHIAQAGPDYSQPTDQGGLAHLQHFLQPRAHASAISGKPALYLGHTPVGAAPWFPISVQPLSPDALATLPASAQSNLALTLLSGEKGDFPILGNGMWQHRVRTQNEPTRNR